MTLFYYFEADLGDLDIQTGLEVDVSNLSQFTETLSFRLPQHLC